MIFGCNFGGKLFNRRTNSLTLVLRRCGEEICKSIETGVHRGSRSEHPPVPLRNWRRSQSGPVCPTGASRWRIWFRCSRSCSRKRFHTTVRSNPAVPAPGSSWSPPGRPRAGSGAGPGGAAVAADDGPHHPGRPLLLLLHRFPPQTCQCWIWRNWAETKHTENHLKIKPLKSRSVWWLGKLRPSPLHCSTNFTKIPSKSD